MVKDNRTKSQRNDRLFITKLYVFIKNQLVISDQIAISFVGYCLHKLMFWEKFCFDSHQYHYFIHRYNYTYTNERAVEIPIIRDIVKQYQNKRILEVGNVLSHYYKIDHTVVDKYEKNSEIVNKDIAQYVPKGKFDLIVSISTLEHVGWDEVKKDPKKIPFVLNHLRSLLADRGELIFTVPIGYNTDLDNLIKKKKLPSVEMFFLKRVSKTNKWIETDYRGVSGAKMYDPFPYANSLLVGKFKK